MREKRYKLLIFVLLPLAAFVIRLLAVLFWIDVPGDGPARAILAYNWSRSPYIVIHDSGWLPGFTYQAGILSLIVRDPAVSTRVLNLAMGTFTLPVFYLLIRRVFGQSTALFSALVLVFFPLHIGLSASSLTEASFLFELVAGVALLIAAAENTRSRALYLGLSLLSLGLAVMTRYEAWLLIPLFPSYYILKTRKASTAILMMVILVAFPAAWLLGNRIYTGDFFYGFSGAFHGTRAGAGAYRAELLGAIKVISRKSVSHLGWILSLAIAWGAILQLAQVSRRKFNLERALYVLITSISWIFLLSVAIARVERLWDRYLLFGFVMTLPFASLPLFHYFKHSRQWRGVIISLAVVLVGASVLSIATSAFRVSTFDEFSPVYVTRKQPAEIKKVAEWLQRSSYRDDPVLLTSMDWQSTYLPFYFPEIGSRQLIVSSWTKDSDIQIFLENQRPSLLITRDGDDESWARVEGVLGRKIQADSLIHREGTVKVYDLKR